MESLRLLLEITEELDEFLDEITRYEGYSDGKIKLTTKWTEVKDSA